MSGKTRRYFQRISPSPEELFNFLIGVAQPNMILDIGSRDATEAKRFKRISPRTSVIAVEPHPILYAKILVDPEVAALGVKHMNLALSDKQGELAFYVNDSNSLNGSLRRTKETVGQVTVKVDCLDSVVAGLDGASIFLWIDAEGMAWEVIHGGISTLDRVTCIHVEYETKHLFEGQKTFTDLKALLAEKGFMQCADSYCAEVFQGNALFIKGGSKGVPLLSAGKLAAMYPWFMAKALYRKFKAARPN